MQFSPLSGVKGNVSSSCYPECISASLVVGVDKETSGQALYFDSVFSF
jgi:hypothetical protein